jgi:hypothetical protein
LAVVGVVAILALTLTPQSASEVPSARLCVICGERGTTDAILNLLLFAPFGTGLALAGAPIRRAAVCAFFVSAFIELAQLTLVPGRDANTGDLLMNTIGAALGAVVPRHWRLWVMPRARDAAWLGFGGAAVWLITLALTAVALMPAPSGDRPFVQIKPDIPTELRRFPGEITGAFLDGMPLLDGPLPDTAARVRSALLRGDARFEGSVRPVLPEPSWSAILLRIVDRKQRTELQLTQTSDALLFEPRLRAADMRLDPIVARLDRVFPSAGERNCDTTHAVRIFGQVTSGYLVAGASGAGCRRELRIPLRPTYGWALVVPFEYAMGAEVALFTAAWIAMFTFVWSYWIGAWTESLVRGNAVGAALLVVGLGVVPALFGSPRSGVSEWIAATVGLEAGLTLWRTASRSATGRRLSTPASNR